MLLLSLMKYWTFYHSIMDALVFIASLNPVWSQCHPRLFLLLLLFLHFLSFFRQLSGQAGIHFNRLLIIMNTKRHNDILSRDKRNGGQCNLPPWNSKWPHDFLILGIVKEYIQALSPWRYNEMIPHLKRYIIASWKAYLHALPHGFSGCVLYNAPDRFGNKYQLRRQVERKVPWDHRKVNKISGD